MNRRLAILGGLAYLGWRVARAHRTIDLAGKVVLVTGGSRGLGLLLAREFARHGANVVICARDRKELDRARADLASRGARALAISCDVTDQEQVTSMVERVERELGPVDVLVNNAGIIQVGPLSTMTLDDFRRSMDVNFWGALYTTLAVLPRMRARGAGRIVNITSIGSKIAIPHLIPYDCAKFAMRGLSEGLRAELARDGVVVTTIVPGLMRTGSPVNALFKGQHAKEFAWFSLGDALPLTAMDARRAARRIVLATRRGEAEVTLTIQARLAGLVHDLFPGATADALGLVNRLLPDAGEGGTESRRGMELATPVSPSPLTTLLNRAARRYNQFGGEVAPAPRHARQIGLR